MPNNQSNNNNRRAVKTVDNTYACGESIIGRIIDR